MRTLCVLLCIATLSGRSNSQAFECKPIPMTEVSWLVGLWQSETVKGRTSYEKWARHDDLALRGTTFRVSGTDTVVLEHVTIQQLGNCLLFVAAPRGQRPTAFTLIDTTGGDWVFENPEHDFPTRVVYSRPKGEVLNARIEGLVESKPKVIPFVYRRSSTP